MRTLKNNNINKNVAGRNKEMERGDDESAPASGADSASCSSSVRSVRGSGHSKNGQKPTGRVKRPRAEREDFLSSGDEVILPKIATSQRGRGRPAGRGGRKATRLEEPDKQMNPEKCVSSEKNDATTNQVTVTKETARTGGELAHLTAEVDRLRRENAELKANLSRMGHTMEPAKSQPRANKKDSDDQEVLLLIRKELAALVSRINALEGILLRPPLARGDKGQTSYAAVVAKSKDTNRDHRERVSPGNSARVLEKGVKPGSKTTGGSSRMTTASNGRGSNIAVPTVRDKYSGSTDPPGRSEPLEFGRPEWEVAGAKRAAKKAARRKAQRSRKAAQKEVARLRAPKTAAVVVTLQPGAEEQGTSYRDVLSKVGTLVNFRDLGITEGVRLRVTRTGARMLEVPGSTSGPIADALAEKLRASFDTEVVRISRPTKCANLRIVGLDDSATVEEVVAAVAKNGGCPIGQVKTGAIRPGLFGLRTVVVTCPVAAANKIVEGRRILVGWVSAQVKLLDPQPLRCYRCLTGNHVGVQCTSAVDRSDCCFRCGQPGHKAGVCNAPPHCASCAEAGRPAEHRAGGRACSASTKPKSGIRSSAAAAAVSNITAGSNVATEVVMGGPNCVEATVSDSVAASSSAINANNANPMEDVMESQ